ncbi:hypothetical protein E4U41_000725, partial [Claviceps citrina]
MPGPDADADADASKRPRRAVQAQAHREREDDLTICGWLATLAQATYISKAIKALPPPSRTQRLSFHEHMAYQAMRDYQARLSAVQIQNLLPSTGT